MPNHDDPRHPLASLRAASGYRLTVGQHVVDLDSLCVVSGDDRVKLTVKGVGVLLELARHAGQTVSHDQLLDCVWAGTCPTRNVLSQAIKELRRALRDDYIETVPKVGYRLVARSTLLESSAAAERRRQRRDGGSIAGIPLAAVDTRGGIAGADTPARRGRTAILAVVAALALCAAALLLLLPSTAIGG